MTKQAIIDSTVRYYRKNPRGYDDDNSHCVYNGKGGIQCAVGRCFNKEGRIRWGNARCSAQYITPIDIYLKEIYRGHHPKFWQELQTFHDANYNWVPDGNGNKLTKMGLNVLQNLRNRFPF